MTMVSMSGITDPKDLGIKSYAIQKFSHLREYFPQNLWTYDENVQEDQEWHDMV